MVILLQGDPARAGEMCTETREWCRTRGEQWWLGHALIVSAYAAAADGDPTQAAIYSRDSLRAHHVLNDTLGLAAGLERLGWFAARNALGDVAFDVEYGNGGELTLDDAVAYALGPGEPNQRAEPDGRLPLTRREFQVAQLVAQGQINKQIASQLLVSQRTAETHVENILRKLGFTNRTQVATWVVQRSDRCGPPGE
jgi:DNA-binding CsgD family transcriptional regulator